MFGLESKESFLHGVNRNSLKLQGGKDILTLYGFKHNLTFLRTYFYFIFFVIKKIKNILNVNLFTSNSYLHIIRQICPQKLISQSCMWLNLLLTKSTFIKNNNNILHVTWLNSLPTELTFIENNNSKNNNNKFVTYEHLDEIAWNLFKLNRMSWVGFKSNHMNMHGSKTKQLGAAAPTNLYIFCY
jgi:hypothetical protein